MADTTITVTYGGEPLVGAEVITSGGEIDEAYTTDGDGKVTIDLAIGYANCVLVAVRHASFPMDAYIAVWIMEGASDYLLTIPAYAVVEVGGDTRGIHAHFVTKL